MLETVWKEIAPIICTAAPAVATALGSPLAGVATSLVCNSFNVDPKKPENLVSKILENIPVSTEKLKSIDYNSSELFNKFLNWKSPSEMELNLKMKWCV